MSLLFFVACAPQRPPEGPTNEKTPVTLSVPEVKPVQAGSETQETKGVTISVVPASFKVVEVPKKTCVPAPADGGGSLFGGLVKVDKGPEKKHYVVTSQSGYVVDPKTITFAVNVTNHTTHVLRLQGSVLKLNIDGQQVQLSADGTRALLDGVLTPNEARTFVVGGPAVDPTFREATLDFQLFDIPVDIDKAGNVVEKTNFAWTFKAKMESKTIDSEKKTENLALDPGEAQALGCPVVSAPSAAL